MDLYDGFMYMIQWIKFTTQEYEELLYAQRGVVDPTTCILNMPTCVHAGKKIEVHVLQKLCPQN